MVQPWPWSRWSYQGKPGLRFYLKYNMYSILTLRFASDVSTMAFLIWSMSGGPQTSPENSLDQKETYAWSHYIDVDGHLFSPKGKSGQAPRCSDALLCYELKVSHGFVIDVTFNFLSVELIFKVRCKIDAKLNFLSRSNIHCRRSDVEQSSPIIIQL